MRRYSDQILSATTGLSMVGATVSVFLAGTTTLATLYQANSTTVTRPNPIQATGGVFSFYIPDGRYDIVTVSGGRTRTLPDVEIFDLTEMKAAANRLLIPGPPGGNIMSVGLFTQLPVTLVPLGTDLIQTSGHHIPGIGPAQYSRVPIDPGLPGAWQTQDASGRWWKLVVPGYLLIEWFGGVEDCPRVRWDGYMNSNYTASLPDPVGVTDVLPALRDAWGGLKGQPTSETATGRSLTPIRFISTDGTKCYWSSDTWIPPYGVCLEGSGHGDLYPYSGTMVRFPANKGALVLPHWGRQYFYGNHPTPGDGFSANCNIRSFWFMGGGGTNDDAHGLLMRTVNDMSKCVFSHFAGRAIDNDASTNVLVGSPNYGITSGSKHDGNGWTDIRRDGCWTAGTDAGASQFLNMHSNRTGLAGIVDINAFNNDYGDNTNVHTYGQRALGGCWKNGYCYALVQNDLNAGQVDPETHPDVWVLVQAAAAPIDGRYPAWSSNGDYRLSLPVLFGGSTRPMCYIENYYLPGFTIGDAFACGGERHWLDTAATMFYRGAIETFVVSKPMAFNREYTKPHPIHGSYLRAGIGGRDTDSEGGLRVTRQSESGGLNRPWIIFGAKTKDAYRVGFGEDGTGNPDTALITSFDTTMKLGRATPQPLVWIAKRFALGGLGGDRRMETCNGAPDGTGRARGEILINTAAASGEPGLYYAMGDGTVKPLAIVGP